MNKRVQLSEIGKSRPKQGRRKSSICRGEVASLASALSLCYLTRSSLHGNRILPEIPTTHSIFAFDLLFVCSFEYPFHLYQFLFSRRQTSSIVVSKFNIIEIKSYPHASVMDDGLSFNTEVVSRGLKRKVSKKRTRLQLVHAYILLAYSSQFPSPETICYKRPGQKLGDSVVNR